MQDGEEDEDRLRGFKKHKAFLDERKKRFYRGEFQKFIVLPKMWWLKIKTHEFLFFYEKVNFSHKND